jgi:hypothetical protein
VLGELLERTPAAFRKLLILEKITNFEEKAPFLATRQVYRGSANSAGNCGDMYRKVKGEQYKEEAEGRAQPP